MPLPAGGKSDMDWNSLVDTATKAIFNGEEEKASSSTSAESPPNSTTAAAAPPAADAEEIRRLMERVAVLEQELVGERAGAEELKSEVDHLKEENVRLQEESQTAAQQLRRFTEWFFQTIDKS